MPLAMDGVLFAGILLVATAVAAVAFSLVAGYVARLRHEAQFGARQDALWRHVTHRIDEIVERSSGLGAADTERLALRELEPLIAMHVALADFMPEIDRRAVEAFLLGVMRRHLRAEIDKRPTAVAMTLAGAA